MTHALTKLVNGERVNLTPAEKAAIEAQWDAGTATTKRPLKRWAFRFALRNHTALVERVIADISDPIQREAIKHKWDHGDIFHFDRDETKMMLAAILTVDPTFDADAIWATGEAAEYGQ